MSGILQSLAGNYAPPSGGGIAFVQQKVGTTADGSAGLTITFDTPLSAGNSVMVQIAADPDKVNFATPPTLVGGGAGVLTEGLKQTAADFFLFNFYIHGVTGGETAVTFTLDAAHPICANASEWSGLSNAGPEVTSGGGLNTQDPEVTFGSPPTSPRNLTIASYMTGTDVYDTGPTGGFTRMTPTSSTGVFMETAYLIQSAANIPVATWHLDSTEDVLSNGTIYGGV